MISIAVVVVMAMAVVVVVGSFDVARIYMANIN